MKIAISGASGFLGQHLRMSLARNGHTVLPLVRNSSKNGIFWNPDTQEIDTDRLAGVHAVIHLAGESVAERWNSDKKALIYSSRVRGTRLLVNAITQLQPLPLTFLCASAIGYYGERGAEVLTEDSAAGNSFLARVCVDWESVANLAAESGIRTANLRFGIVLSTEGGAFPRMLAPFELGAGGRLGSGKQYMSWIALEDAMRAIEFVLADDRMEGPINVVAPNAVTNTEFAESLANVLGKPALVPVPATMVYLAYGSEMADEVLLASDRVVPEKLSGAGFKFKHENLTSALKHIVGNRV